MTDFTDALKTLIREAVQEGIRAERSQNGAAETKRRLLTVEDAAIYLGRTKEAVQHLVSSSDLPTVRSDRRVFFDVRDLDQWIEAHKE